jgi:TolA-binding protein
MRFGKLPVLIVPLSLWLGGTARAQGALNAPAPFTIAVPATVESPGSGAVTLAAAQQAQEMGFSSLAAGMYRKLLAAPGADQASLTLALASALLDDGQPAEADKLLQGFSGVRGAAWHVRAGLAAIQLRKTLDVARTEHAAIHPEELSVMDKAWADFLLGSIYDFQVPRDTTKANEFYIKAETAAPNEMARARFKLAGELVRLNIGNTNDAALRQGRADYENLRGKPMGIEYAKLHAVALNLAGRKSEAMTFLRLALLTLLPQERAQADRLRLAQGMIGDRAPGGEGRVALNQLLIVGTDPLLQRVALQLLAQASQDDVSRGVFRAELAKLIDAAARHPIKENLLLARAQVTLAEKDYAQAEKDVRDLLEQYPGSQYRANAFGTLTASAWEQRRYRAAADNARKTRAELPATAEAARWELVVLEAEAWFRAGDAGDFRSAADAYAAALKDRPAGVKPGDLMFQRVLSEIKAGALETAQPLLDELAKDPAFDLENRWRAEWNLSRALQLLGPAGVKQAYARVSRLLGEKIADNTAALNALPPDLRARMAWLQARLALDAGEPERAIKLADEMSALLTGADEALAKDVVSQASLAKAEAHFTLGREADALKTLKQLREDPKFAKSDAAVQSYIIEAAHYAAQEKTVDAQKLYTRLADEFPNHEQAPYALYLAALQAERRGQEATYKEANRLIEDLVRKYPRSDLIFAARFKQGNLLRNLNDLPAAQYAYDDLLQKPASQENLIIAQLALAECHNAQSSSDRAGDNSHFAMAKTLFEHLLDRADAPVDVRVEAGFNLGELWVRSENRQKALEVWWTEVVSKFLLDPKKAAELQSKGRFWMARTLYRTGEVYEQEGKIDAAKEAWLLLLKSGLGGGEELAKAKLARFGPVEVKP